MATGASMAWAGAATQLQFMALGCPPSQNASHHQDHYCTFLVGKPYKPSFATVTGRGDNPMYNNETIAVL